MANGKTDKLEKHFEIYKLTVDMADKVSSRRMTANTFFLTLHSALVVISERLDLIYVAVIGLLFCVTWWMLLKSYRDLNTAKFDVILELEKDFPVKPFTDEWKYLKKDPVEGWKTRYAELGQVEQFVPIILGAIYIFIILKITCWLQFICHI